MTLNSMLRCMLSSLVFIAPAFAQSVEITGYVGSQVNGGYDFSTALFHRLEVGNTVNYGVSAGYLLGEHFGIEFLWNEAKADTHAQPNGGGSSVKLFTLRQDQFLGNFLFHFTNRETKLRPYIFFGAGASDLSPQTSGVNGSTRFVGALGGGVKYNLSHHLGLRGQLKWSPTYLNTTDGGYWCDPFWGGCWLVGDNHYLHEFDITGGITFRF